MFQTQLTSFNGLGDTADEKSQLFAQLDCQGTTRELHSTELSHLIEPFF